MSILCYTDEALSVKVSLPNVFSIVIGGSYRPPHCSIINFNDYINSTLFNNQHILRSKCIPLGDFNIDVLKINECQSYNNFYNIMTKNGFNLTIDKPTYCTRGIASSLLDHFWIIYGYEFDSHVNDYLISHHLSISLNLKINFKSQNIKKSFRDLSDANFERFNKNKIELFRWFSLNSYITDDEFDRFETWLNNLLDRYFPYKTKFMSLKRINMPWISDQVFTFIQAKNTLFINLKQGIILIKCSVHFLIYWKY